jgi:hypothetical protein
MYQGGHHVVSLNGKYNMYRNNYFTTNLGAQLEIPLMEQEQCFKQELMAMGI